MGTRQMARACTGRLRCATSTRVCPGCACGACVFDSGKKKAVRDPRSVAGGEVDQARVGCERRCCVPLRGKWAAAAELGRGIGWLAGWCFF